MAEYSIIRYRNIILRACPHHRRVKWTLGRQGSGSRTFRCFLKTLTFYWPWMIVLAPADVSGGHSSSEKRVKSKSAPIEEFHAAVWRPGLPCCFRSQDKVALLMGASNATAIGIGTSSPSHGRIHDMSRCPEPCRSLKQ